MSQMKLGLQMWSVHDICVEKGIPETLRLISEMGYEGFEFALGDSITLKERCGADITEVKAALKEYGVKAIGSHVSFDGLMDNPIPILEECLQLELPYAGIGPIFCADRATYDEQKRLYEKLVPISRLFQSNGIQLQVHCAVFGYLHDYKGRPTMEGMIEECGVEYLQPEFDTAWMICSGADPKKCLSKYKNHVDVLHFKDFHPLPEHSEYILVDHNTIGDEGYGCAVGDNGVQNVAQIIKIAQECGTKWIVTELWNEKKSLKNAQLSANLLKKFL